MSWDTLLKIFLSTGLMAFLLSTIFLLEIKSCSNNRNEPLRCIAEYIEGRIEKDKIEKFIEMDGKTIWREGWEYLTFEIAEDYFVIDDCNIDEYLKEFDSSIDDLRGQMIFVYSMHSYFRNGEVESKMIEHQVDSLFY